MIIKRIKKMFNYPKPFWILLDRLGLYNNLDDKTYIEKKFEAIMGKKLDLNNPKGFNEKIQWLKLNNRKQEYVDMVDKYKSKEYVSSKLGSDCIIPTIGVWDNFSDIDFDKLPNQFVLKTTHDSGGVVICKDKKTFNVNEAKKKLNKSLKRNYFLVGREWPYKDVPRKIICEKFMIDDTLGELRDYKFFCFDGYVDCVMVCKDRDTGYTKFYFYDKDWNLKKYNKRSIEEPDAFVEKPHMINEMFEAAKILSNGIPFLRVDFYECNNKMYFGELTFYPDSGFDPNILNSTEEYFGNLIKLKDNK